MSMIVDKSRKITFHQDYESQDHNSLQESGPCFKNTVPLYLLNLHNLIQFHLRYSNLNKPTWQY